MEHQIEKLSASIESIYGIRLNNRKHVVHSAVMVRALFHDLSGPVYADRLLSNTLDHEWHAIVDQILIHETYFFRNPKQFRFFEDILLRDYASRQTLPGQAAQESLQIASIGCSSGEETYSIAMSVLNTAREKGLYGLNDAKIDAMDLSDPMIRRASLGCYATTTRMMESVKAMNPKYLHSFFTVSEGHHQVKDSVRSLIQFKKKNIIDFLEYPDRFPVKYHYIFCRNVMIYFGFETQQRLIQFLENALYPGGYLFLGDAETLHPYKHNFLIDDEATALVYRKPLMQTGER